eukprot:NODE_9_length_64580_cov_1.431941.p13 type:complete len:419 gc:universal NODE_9_length_64580_cov_1.431941:24484-23228(-)
MMYDKRNNKPYMTDDILDQIYRIIERQGPDSWFTLPVGEFLPEKYKYLEKYLTKEDDTMDVWFDSGVSWSTLNGQADVYIEGNDQFRGWFQSSMLLSVAINGRSPTKQIVCHGFVLDEKGKKMSKSLGNVVDPKQVIHGGSGFKAIGVDGLRFWCASTQFTKDVQIGKRIVEQVGKDLKRWRIAVKYMLGNLNDKLSLQTSYTDLSAIDRWILSELSASHKLIISHYSKYEYHLVVQAINFFVASKLSAPYFETIKDRLYCDHIDSRRRKSAIFTLEIILLAFLKWIAPITPALAEEAYHVLGNEKSVFNLNFDNLNYENESIQNDFAEISVLRTQVNRILDSSIKNQFVSSPMDAYVILPNKPNAFNDDLSDLLGVSKVILKDVADITVQKASMKKCKRCWKKICEEDICSRCAQAQ